MASCIHSEKDEEALVAKLKQLVSPRRANRKTGKVSCIHSEKDEEALVAKLKAAGRQNSRGGPIGKQEKRVVIERQPIGPGVVVRALGDYLASFLLTCVRAHAANTAERVWIDKSRIQIQ